MADKHHAIAAAQREFIGAIADRVEKGEPFNRAAERSLIAGILRAWAKQIPDAALDARGVAKLNPGYVAIHYACLVNGQGMSKLDAMDALADIYEMPSDAVAEAISKFEGHAMRLVPRKTAAKK